MDSMGLPAVKNPKDTVVPSPNAEYLKDLLTVMSIDTKSDESLIETLPFSIGDVTAGIENEFQTVVVGESKDVDLPLEIAESSYYKNITRRIKSGDASKKIISELDRYLQGNHEKVWDNSWVRFPRRLLGNRLNLLVEYDLSYDKTKPSEGKRSDLNKFIKWVNGEEYLRIPVSYVLKLGLADATICDEHAPELIKSTGNRMLSFLINDNTSPEILSFTPVHLDRTNGLGCGAAREMLKRYFLTQLLIMYANRRFGLSERGQHIYLYLSSHPPIRQKRLNSIISDYFYRELFMNPCLSGWDKGEEKFHYMELCHQVLSRSHLNTISKLKEAGIITRNLIVLPNISNISLANNGTHISIGSKKLAHLLYNPYSGFGNADEKYIGDLVIKIVEHFLPLFVGTYSASPYRLDFWDFHPEKALGFLPHELDYTHLRMIWRRWKKKAHIKLFGQSITPFGPHWFDRLLSIVLRLKGDFVIDFRLIDYLICLLSTEQSPGLDGTIDNDKRLKTDLATLGIFDTNMSPYFLYRLREYSKKGFSGFEGRYYSIFDSILNDMGEAVSLQILLTALAYKYIFFYGITHRHIPDDPTIESERRQIFFGTAIGIPTFYIKKDTHNKFMLRILKNTEKSRFSRRYPGYIRIYGREYNKALVKIIMDDAKDLIELMGLEETIVSLKERIEQPEIFSAGARITQGILKDKKKKNPLQLSGDEFNIEAEKYYRNTLRRKHLEEAYSVVLDEFKKMDSHLLCSGCAFKDSLKSILGDLSATLFLLKRKKDLLEEKLPEDEIKRLIQLIVLTVHNDIKEFEAKDKSIKER
ncbi:MAG: hypothetical protein N2596_08335 [Syntrophorhabdaceae bacterium]|nr:hypothetical protein [Syntrophorhabdaceae bacterium]